MSYSRRSPRLELAFPVLVEAGEELRRFMAVNVGAQGMLFKAPEPYAIGEQLRVTFCLPSTDVELAAQAEVVHATWVHDGQGGHFRIGLLFGDFDQGEFHPPLRCLPS